MSPMESPAAPTRVGPHWTSFFAHLDETVVLLTDADGLIAYASPSVTRWLGFRPEELTGTALELLVHPHEAVELMVTLSDCTATSPHGALHRLKRADGGWCRLELTLVSLRSDALAGGVLVAGREVS